ncbi:hypothetical protein [Cellulomonas fimi]|uniref:Janus kinase and microtubule interacting protein 1 n=1 Tax=Cellulomonas fimi (strain ATCC 484 / DSM 20113 / JCM 1341 / CCUG 24087 / LMG 16345 / NBRC 15513 / NCIMB 8980 / NCTC 7547 / NRS-133) TaxID=590998 RepID=F4H6Q3_CELFA|nr:hypothetical protein [Cellulomonas fimi]AEE46814.1 janus kinase and microtubule interacting protein 1 [Cellulomonas fimi ATCC 484]NNH06357.1 hypothetical protein [Cellulomonas fimi]VEH34264.1 Uncharacterised protein [Cellulomonas fimi]
MTLTERDLRRMHLLHERELRARLHRAHRTEVLAAREVLLRGGRVSRVPNGQAGRAAR